MSNSTPPAPKAPQDFPIGATVQYRDLINVGGIRAVVKGHLRDYVIIGYPAHPYQAAKVRPEELELITDTQRGSN